MARPNWEYIRVDVQLPDHPKLDSLGYAAKWTLLELWCWCAKNTTDGFVRDAKWRTFGPSSARTALVSARLAERVPGGYQMHDYLDHQRSLDEIREVSAKRSAAGKRSAEARAKAKQDAEQLVEHGVEQAAEMGSEPVDNPGILTGNSEKRPTTSRSRHSGASLSTGQSERPETTEHAGQARSDPQQLVEQTGSKPATEAEAEAEADLPVTDVINRSNGQPARATRIDQIIITEIQAVTGRVITAEWAATVRGHVLEGRHPADPVAYVRQAIRSEPDPSKRFLPQY